MARWNSFILVAAEAIIQHGDEGIDLLKKYGNDAVDAMKKGIDPDLMKQLDELGIEPKDYAERGITSKEAAEKVIKGGSGSKYEITWDKTINATQEVIEGTNIPKSFTIKGLNVNGKEVWVHGNATKHMGEFINSAKGTIIGENELMLSFQETVSQILPEVQSGRNFFNINGWEIGVNGDTGVIYHALYK